MTPAEHLHVYAAIEHLDQAVIRLSGIWLEEHQRHLTLRREHRRIALRDAFWEKCIRIFSASSFNGSCAWIRPSSLTAKLAIFCMKSNSVNGNVAVISEIFRNFTYKFFKNYPRISP